MLIDAHEVNDAAYHNYETHCATIGASPCSQEDYEARVIAGQAFPGIAEAAAAATNHPVLQKSRRAHGMDEMTANRMDKLVAEWTRALRIGIRAATILNMSPLQLRGPGIHTSHIVIPPCPSGQMFLRYVVSPPKSLGEMQTSWRDERDDVWSPVLHHPIELAEDFNQQYYNSGGVVVFEGDHDPMEDPRVRQLIEESDTRLIAQAREQWRDAQHQWNSPNRSGARNIGTTHRAYCQLLLDRRIYTDIPPWFDATPETKNQSAVKCGRCSVYPDKDSWMCKNCGYVIDPYRAYTEMEIDESDNSLKRLTRVQLEELGISRFVLETQDERRLRIAAGGEAPVWQDPAPEAEAGDDIPPTQQ